MNQNGMMECLRRRGPWKYENTHENILPLENSVFQGSSASKQMLADFFNSVPAPGYELLLAWEAF